MSSVDWYKVYERLTISFDEKLARLRRRNNYVASLFAFFEKVFAICNFFNWSVFRCDVLRPFLFYLFEVQSTVLVSSSSQRRKCVDLAVIFNKGRNFCGIFTKLQRLSLHKILTLVQSRKLIAVNFTFLYSM